jgi:hypothetical protein
MAHALSADGGREFLDEQGCLQEQPVVGEGHSVDDDGFLDENISLIEENARLRGLVVKLTDIILKNVVDQN